MKGLDIGVQNTELYELSYRKDIVRLTGRAQINMLSDELIRKKVITESNLVGKISEKLVKKCISGHNCFSRRLYFSVDLNVYPCVMERRISHGIIKNNSLDELLDKNILNMNKDYVDECKNCEFRYCCYDCRPDSNGGGIAEKPWYCTYYPLRGVWEDVDKFIIELKKVDNVKS